MKTKTPLQYAYYVYPISEDDEPAYKALIPAFDNAVVYGESLEEIEKGIHFTIESEIREIKNRKKTPPKPDHKTAFNGKILVRMSPFLHEKIALEAQAAGKSVNRYIQEKLAR